MRRDAFIEGLQILNKHYNEDNTFAFGAEHDTFYAYSTDTPLEDKEVERMVELGWFQENVARDEETDDFTAACYVSTEGWVAYV
jgi:hypothetical protein